MIEVRKGALISAIVAVAATVAAQPQAIFIVRHAERAPIDGHVPADTGISVEGKTRAEHLAQQLKDAGITSIFTSEYKRTAQTAEPLAQSLGIRPEVVPAGDMRGLLRKIKTARGNVLVVGHSNTLPQLIAALGASTHVRIAEGDYDNLFIVVPCSKPQLIHLHYR
jgi:broad specificity phosphatase PhoE